MHDPDILAIQRKRRQEGKCLKCAVRSGCAVLCRSCRAKYAYCPMCETLHERRPNMRPGQSSEYCNPCNTLRARRWRKRGTAAEYLRKRQAKRHKLLPEIIRRYKKGEPLGKAAAALGLTRSQIDHLIYKARRFGEWPEGLSRRAATNGTS